MSLRNCKSYQHRGSPSRDGSNKPKRVTKNYDSLHFTGAPWTGMNAIDEIKTRLSKYPDIRFESNASSIRVSPLADDGFEVLLTVNRGGYTVFFNGWHEEFIDQDDALNCFAFGLF